MSAVKGTSSRFGAIKGLITEQNDTNFEPDSMVAAENVVPEINGNLRRRGGMDVITASGGDIIAGIHPVSLTNLKYGAVSKYKWENPNRSFNADVIVIQIGDVVYFFKHAEDIISNIIGQINIAQYTTNGTYIREQQCGYAVISGYLVIVNRYMNPLVVKCGSTGTISVERELHLKMRVTDRLTSGVYGSQDGWGVADILYRPGHLNDDHHFDLRNAGWPASTKCTDNETGASASVKSPIAFTKSSIGVYPAIADVFLANKTSSVEEPEALDTFSPWELEKSEYSTTLPPRGHFVTPVESFDMLGLMEDEDAAIGATGISGYNGNNMTLGTSVRPYHVGALNGHVIFITKDYLGREIIAYSKLVMSPADMEICYQEADPTADEINDIVPTDGGVIPLNHIPEITHVEEGLGGLVVFTIDGIHIIAGNSDSGFNATSQRVMKLSDIACLSGQGIVKLDDRFYFWNQDGLVVIGRDQYGDIQTQNLTRGTIDLFVKQFSKNNLQNAIGDVDTLEGKIYYTLPTSKGGETILNRYKSNIVLVLDTQLGGFYYHRISYESDCPHLLMPVVVGGNASMDYETTLQTTGGEFVSTTDGYPVKTNDTILVSVSNALIFMCAAQYNTTMGIAAAKMHDGIFRDWGSFRAATASEEGLNYVSFAEFMHKRDANLASGTNLTSIQSFFKVKDVNTINIPGDSNIPEDPVWVEFSCPMVEPVETLYAYPTNCITGLRFTALLAPELPSETSPMWYCRGSRYTEWTDAVSQYEYDAPAIMQKHRMMFEPTSGPVSVAGYELIPAEHNYTEMFATCHIDLYATAFAGRVATFRVNFNSFGHGIDMPIVGSYVKSTTNWLNNNGDQVQREGVRYIEIPVHNGGVGLASRPGYSYPYDYSPRVVFTNLMYDAVADYDQTAYALSMADYLAKTSTPGNAYWPPTGIGPGWTSSFATAIEAWAMEIMDGLHAVYASSNEREHVALDVKQGDMVQVHVVQGETTTHIAAHHNSVTKATTVLHTDDSLGKDSWGFRVDEAPHPVESGQGIWKLADLTIRTATLAHINGLSWYGGNYTPTEPPAPSSEYYMWEDSAYTDASGWAVPSLTITKVHVDHVYEIYDLNSNPYVPPHYQWDVSVVDQIQVRIADYPANAATTKATTTQTVLMPSAAVRADCTMTGVYGCMIPYMAGSTIERLGLLEQMQGGCPAIYDVVYEGCSASIAFPDAPEWAVKGIDCVRGVYCQNSSTRGNFFIKPDGVNPANPTLEDAESKRRALLGTDTETIATFANFYHTTAGPGGIFAPAGTTDSKVVANVDFGVAREAGYTVYSIGGAWFNKSSNSTEAASRTREIMSDKQNIKYADYGYNETTVPLEGYGDHNPVHCTSVCMHPDVLQQLSLSHTVTIGTGTYTA